MKHELDGAAPPSLPGTAPISTAAARPSARPRQHAYHVQGLENIQSANCCSTVKRADGARQQLTVGPGCGTAQHSAAARPKHPPELAYARTRAPTNRHSPERLCGKLALGALQRVCRRHTSQHRAPQQLRRPSSPPTSNRAHLTSSSARVVFAALPRSLCRVLRRV